MINLKDFLVGDEVFYTNAFQKAIDCASEIPMTMGILFKSASSDKMRA